LRTKAYPAFSQRDNIGAYEARDAREAAGIHSGLAMLADVGLASAQDRLRVGALIAVRGTGNVLETVLKEKGWIVGRNLQIEHRITGGDTDLTRAYARERLALQPDDLFAVTI
jgi:putative tryptophan/tyrosine transport system substrate-binding protein